MDIAGFFVPNTRLSFFFAYAFSPRFLGQGKSTNGGSRY
jgi:hypothetical protein